MEDSILYIQFHPLLLFRLNLSKLWLPRSSPRPVFEKFRYPSSLPIDGRHGYMIVDSKLYILGGEPRRRQASYQLDVFPSGDNWLIDNDDTAMSDYFHGYVDRESNIPSLNGHKLSPIIITIEEKIYVLSIYLHGKKGKCRQAIFEVFDPQSRSWTVLPNPPESNHLKYYLPIISHFTLGHKLVIQRKDTLTKFYCFDTRKKTWSDAPDMHFFGFAQFKDFYIGIPKACQDVHAYKLDSNGGLIHCRELVELRELFFSPIDKYPFATVIQVNDCGLMFLLCAGVQEEQSTSRKYLVRVALFKVFTNSGDTCLYTHIKATEIFSVFSASIDCLSSIKSVFLSGDYLKNLDDDKLMMLEKLKKINDDKVARIEEKLKKLDDDRLLQMLEKLKNIDSDKLMRVVEKFENFSDDKLVRMVENWKKLDDDEFMQMQKKL